MNCNEGIRGAVSILGCADRYLDLGNMVTRCDDISKCASIVFDRYVRYGHPLCIYIKVGKRYILQSEATDNQLRGATGRYMKCFCKYFDFTELLRVEYDGVFDYLLTKYHLRYYYEKDSLRLHIVEDYYGEEKELFLANELAEKIISRPYWSTSMYVLHSSRIPSVDFKNDTTLRSLKYFDENEFVYMRRNARSFSNYIPVKVDLFLKAVAAKGYKLVETNRFLEAVPL